MLKAILLFSLSILNIMHFTSSLMLNTSDGCLIWSWLIFDIWTNPSIPGSNSTNAPKSLILTTFPKTAEFTAYFSSTTLHGSGVKAFILNDNFFSALSKLSILTSTISPIFNTSSHELICFQEICDKWINPSIPLISAKAPNFVNLLISAFTTSPSCNDSHAAASFSALASSKIPFLEATIFERLSLEKSINLTFNVFPTKLSLSSTYLISICEAGINILTPL